jgi:Na+-driven multidrug efflux pump
MDVEGVAIATVVSQGISAVLCLIVMFKGDGFSKFSLKYFRIYKEELKEIIKVGLPSGLQASMFSISNVIIQSTINAFGAIYTAGNTVAIQFEGFVCMAGNSVAIANMSIVSQNYGARNKKRIIRSMFYAGITASVVDYIIGIPVVLFADQICSIMTNDPVIIEIAKIRLNIMCLTFVTGAIMDTLTYALRSLGKSTTAMVISIIFVCVFRIVWLNTVYLLNPTFEMIFWSYPISWTLCMIANLFFVVPAIKKIKEKPATAQ